RPRRRRGAGGARVKLLSLRAWLLAPVAWAMSLATPGAASALPRGELPPPSGWEGLRGEPGSGSAREPTGAPDRRALSVPPARRPKSAEDDKALAELEHIFARYRRAAHVAADTLAVLTVVEAERGRGKLQKKLDAEIAAHKQKALQLREAAIARYDRFLGENPSDPSWTPEILLRLAELPFEEIGS